MRVKRRNGEEMMGGEKDRVEDIPFIGVMPWM